MPSTPDGSTPTTDHMDPVFANPTGNCVAPDDGSRPGYNAAGGLKWLPDCQNVLKREYWRVYAANAAQVALLPRPDGAPQLDAPCFGKNHPLAPIVQKYGLCHAATSEAEVTIVNSMNYSDAFVLARYLQSQLVFVSTADGFSPFPIPSDILDACALHPATNSAEFSAICQREANRLEAGIDIGFTYTGAGAVEMAGRLNELYGIRIESDADAGACIDRGQHAAPNATFIDALLATMSPAAPACMPSCTADKADERTIASLPQGPCQPATSPCNVFIIRPCGCGFSGGPSEGYHCACEGGQWECIVTGRSMSGCLPCDDAGIADGADD
jgi:hypothetical protein